MARKKYILFSVILAMGLTSAQAQNTVAIGSEPRGASKISMMGRMALHDYYKEKKNLKTRAAVSDSVMALVTLDTSLSTSTADWLTSKGVHVLHQRDDMCIVRLAYDDVSRLENYAEVKRISFGEKAEPCLNIANKFTGVNTIHAGTGTTPGLVDYPYTGKGVVAGIVDTGFDPNHPMFLEADGKTPRVKLLSIYDKKGNLTKRLSTSEEIKNFTTDNKNDYHGSHVAGIFVGSPVVGKNAEYCGVAPGADIVMSKINGSDAQTFAAMEDIISYAKEQGKPAVINYSWGTILGAHDGTDDRQRYLSKLAKEATICVSAGNDGSRNIAGRYAFSEQNQELGLSLQGKGILQIWGKDATPIKLNKILLYEIGEAGQAEQFYEIPSPPSFTDGQVYVAGSMGGTEEDDHAIQYAECKDIFDDDGYILFSGQVNPANNKYVLTIGFYNQANEVLFADPAFHLVFGGDDQKTYDFYLASMSLATNWFIDNQKEEDSFYRYDMTLSTTATSKNVIAVGMYDNEGHNSGETEGSGEVNACSSYQVSDDGTTLPHICAPGNNVISANNDYLSSAISKADVITMNGKEYGMVTMSGTSMAAPYMAGVAALWLEADPKLTGVEIRDIAMRTAIKDQYVTSGEFPAAKWGAGKIDAYAGLKEVLNRATNILRHEADAKDDQLMMCQTDRNAWEVFVAGATHLDVSLYAINGTLVQHQFAAGNTAKFSTAANVQPGIYVLQVKSTGKCLSRKVVVR